MRRKMAGMMAALVLAAALPAALTAALASTAQASETLERIKDRGSIVLGVRDDRPPMSFRDGEGKMVGFSVDLCLAVSEEVRKALSLEVLPVVFKAVTVEERFDAVVSGEVDILCGATTKTLSRQEKVDFTDLTFVTGATLMSVAENRVPGIEALQGRTVTVVRDTTTLEVLRERLEEAGIAANVLEVEDSQAGIQALLNGRASAYAGDQVVLIGLALSDRSGTRYAISPKLFSFEPFALAVQRDDADFRLLANRALAALNRSGRIQAIYRLWFSQFAKEPPELLKALWVLGATPE